MFSKYNYEIKDEEVLTVYPFVHFFLSGAHDYKVLSNKGQHHEYRVLVSYGILHEPD